MRRRSGTLVAFVALVLGAPSAADAAKLKISGQAVNVSSGGVAKIGVANPNSASTRAQISLRSAGAIIASKRARIPGRAAKKVGMSLTVGAFQELQARGSLPVQVKAKAAGQRTASRRVMLRSSSAAPDSDHGSTPDGPGRVWREGRYQGTYADNNVDLAFNVVESRLFTGPFDSFYITATCRNVNPEYTGPDQVTTDSSAIEPVEATIGADGRFSGEGIYRPSPESAINWKLTGTLSGERISDGEFSVAYTNGYGNPCEGVTRFTAGWYGDYTL